MIFKLKLMFLVCRGVVSCSVDSQTSDEPWLSGICPDSANRMYVTTSPFSSGLCVGENALPKKPIKVIHLSFFFLEDSHDVQAVFT